MDELKLLIETVANLPTLTLWVLGGYLIYKLAILGSLYGTIRYVANKFVEWRININIPQKKEYVLQGLTINEPVALLLTAQLTRLVSTNYIHSSDVIKLKNALDEMEKKNG